MQKILGGILEYFLLSRTLHDFFFLNYTRTGVLDAYRRSLSNMVFGGPTAFAPIISQVVQSMRPGDQNNYYLLLILTAGQIEDLVQTEQVS